LVDRRRDARRWGAAAVGAGLGLLELALVRLAGPPGHQLEVLRQLGEVGADPLASLLALLALAAAGLAAYLLAVLGLRLLASVPGAVGRLAAGASVLAAPATVRHALDRGQHRTVIAGTLGGPGRLDYTVLGDAVNVPPRLQQGGGRRDPGRDRATVQHRPGRTDGAKATQGSPRFGGGLPDPLGGHADSQQPGETACSE
jgi:hypothetical protein